MRGEEPRCCLDAPCETVLVRFPLTRSRMGDVADAGVVGDLKKLSFGLMLSLVGGVTARGMFMDETALIEGIVAVDWAACPNCCASDPSSPKRSNDDGWGGKSKGNTVRAC